MLVTAEGWSMSASEIEWRAGDEEAQERILREAVTSLEAFGDQFFYSTVALTLVNCLLLRKDPDDAEVVSLCETARQRTLPGDLVNFIYFDGIDARRLAHSGSVEEGIALAERGVETADRADHFEVRVSAWHALTETYRLAGRPHDAARAAAHAIAIRTAKGDIAGVAALERRFSELGLRLA
jgi:hypothetical protein